MPELPEVEVVRRGLTAVVVGRTVTDVEVLGAHGVRALRRHVAGAEDFRARLTGRTVIGVHRRGKYLWFALDDGDAVLAHLGMSGQFRVSSAPGDPHPHTRLRLKLAGGDDGAAVLDFLDQRTFGGLSYVADGAELPAPIAHIARDLLDPLFDRAQVIARIRGKASDIKRVLLDQSVVSGIGNIYADEALWAARVRFDSSASSLAAARVTELLDAAVGVMNEALRAGGTSFDALYVNVNGESGYFDRSLQAYGRTGEPCSRCGTPIERAPFMNRSSYFCPRCQPRPRRALPGRR